MSLSEKKLAWLRNKLNECVVPENPSAIDPGEAEHHLHALFGIASAKRAQRGGDFFGMTVTDDEAALVLNSLDPQPLIEHWTSTLTDLHGEAGHSFVGEVASASEIEVDGAILRTGRKRLTFEANVEHGSRRGPPPNELVKRILNDPNDADAYLVYADMLQEAGDIHGEFIALEHATLQDKALEERRNEFLAIHKTSLLGGLAEFTDGANLAPSAVDANWFMGFIRSARIGAPGNGADVLRALLNAPVSGLLQELTLGMLENGGELDYNEAIGDIAATGPHVALRTLFIGDFDYPEEIEMSWAIVGDASPLWQACPALQELTLQGGDIELGEVQAPELRRLSLRTGGLPAAAVKAVVDAKLPKLEELELWFGDSNYGAQADVDAVRPLLARTDLPALKCLRLKNAEFTDDLIGALVESTMLKQLAVLDLALGTMSATGAQRMLADIDSFAHLTEIDVSDNCIESSVHAQLVAHRSVIGGRQDDDGEDDRYVSVGE